MELEKSSDAQTHTDRHLGSQEYPLDFVREMHSKRVTGNMLIDAPSATAFLNSVDAETPLNEATK